jgi:uncharacterized membrane protein (DUF373 family)
MDINDLLKLYFKITYIVLIVLFAVIVTLAVCYLAYLVYDAVAVHSPRWLENHELLDLFGYFLLVLIGVELLATLSAYLNEKVIHVEIVVVVAIIAIARGVILWEPVTMQPLIMFGTAAVIFALCSGYYLIKKGGIQNP